MPIKLFIDPKFEKADNETKQQIKELATIEALKQAISKEDLRIELSKFLLKEYKEKFKILIKGI